MQSNGVVSSTQHSQAVEQLPTSNRSYFSKLTKFLRIRTTSTSTSSTKPQQTTQESSSSRPPPFSNKPSVTVIPSGHCFCFDATESINCGSDNTLVTDCPHRRVLNHSVSTPTICGHRYNSPSEGSTRCPSPAGVPAAMVPLRAHTLPRVLREKAGPVVEIKPDTKQRWNWRLLTKERPTRSSPSLRPSTSSALISNKGASAPSVAASPWGSSFEPTPSLSTILPSDPQHLTLPSRGSIVRLDDDDLLPNPKPSPRNSTNKLARTLGALPPQTDYDDINKPLPNLGSSSRQDIAGSRRKSLSLTTTFTAVPALLRQASRTGPKQSRSKTTLSTLTTDDVFGLADDLSDNWGEPRTGSRASIYSSYSPISPIVFNPPTPTTTKPPRRLPSADNMKLEDVTFASRPHPGATLNRSRSLSFAPLRPKITRLAHLASAGAQAETRPQSVMASPSIPLKAGWLESTPAVLEEEASKARSFVVTHPEYVDEYRNWSGQWNQDNVQDVIKMLRNLK